MPALQTCPRCQKPLAGSQTQNASIQCGACGAVINQAISAGEPPPAAPVSAAATSSASSPAKSSAVGILLLLGLGGLLALGCLLFAGIGSLFWLAGSAGKTDPDETPPLPKVTAEKPKPQEPPPPPPDPRIKIVQPAVDKGVAYLQANLPQIVAQRAAYPGLAGLALLECGVSPDDPAILRIADKIRKDAAVMNANYDLASSLFFLNRWNEARPLTEADRKIVRTFALRIIAGQYQDGIWAYDGIVMSADQEAKLVAALKEETYKPVRAGGGSSMSNTQFAMLAIWGSRKQGVPVRGPLLALSGYYHTHQRPDGGWNYPRERLTATSTCAGLIGLAIERGILENEEFIASHRKKVDTTKKKADLNKGFEYLGKSIGRKKGDPFGGGYAGGGTLFDADAWGDLYFLWTLERVGVIYSMDKINGKDWFDWGYPFVLKAQKPDGSWNDKHPPLIDTCFALLFLKRSNIARDLTEMLRPRTLN